MLYYAAVIIKYDVVKLTRKYMFEETDSSVFTRNFELLAQHESMARIDSCLGNTLQCLISECLPNFPNFRTLISTQPQEHFIPQFDNLWYDVLVRLF